MKRMIAITALLFTWSTMFGQIETTNTITAEHIHIAGTKISMIPPDGFTKATNFAGLQ